jgi:hypothetical protein
MRSTWLALFSCFSLALAPMAVAHAEDRDVIAFGGDAYVPAGQIVDDVAAFGGTVRVDGEVRGDVQAFGGDVLLGPTAIVHGSVDAAGGHIDIAPGARIAGAASAVPVAPETTVDGPEHHEADGPVRSLLLHALLFLFALLLSGAVPERMGAMHVAIVKEPLRTAGVGLLGYAGAVLALVALVITIVGIPLALALGILVPVATYIGLAAAATVIGAALPVERLRGRPVMQILAGVSCLFVASLVPGLGLVAIAVAACLGLGALVRTRFRAAPPTELLVSEGPYRTQPG